MVGVDWARENWTAGLIVSRSAGDGGYVGHSKGRVEAALTGLYPWGRLALSERVDVWGAAGYGTGELSVTPKKPGTDEDGATVRTDLHLRMAAAGLRGNLLDGGRDGLTLTAKTDALIVQTVSDAAHGPDGGNLAAARASVTRLRLGLEGVAAGQPQRRCQLDAVGPRSACAMTAATPRPGSAWISAAASSGPIRRTG